MGRWHRWRRQLLALAVAAVLGAPFAARCALRGLGHLVVHEDPAGPADLVVVSNASPKHAALEAARLWREGLVGRVVIAPWRPDPIDRELERLGIHPARPDELLEAILRAGGVPFDRIVRLPAATNGTRSEVGMLRALAAKESPHRLLYLTARDHTARASWLLRRALPATAVAVRSTPSDPFSPHAWWRDREQARRLAMEYLRWAATLASWSS